MPSHTKAEKAKNKARKKGKKKLPFKTKSKK